MYRCVSYNPFNESVYLRTWTETGDRIDTEIPFRPYLFMEKEGATDAVSIFKTSLLKKTFKNSIERRKFTESTANKRIFHNLSPEQQFLIEMYRDRNGDSSFSQFPLRIFMLDIEVFSPDFFPKPEEARAPINLITIYDTLTQSTHTWGLKEEFYPTLENCIYYKCKDEKDLILRFVEFWKENFPDVMSGWNTAKFDLPYIINRINTIFGPELANQLSPVGRVSSRKVFTDSSFGKEVVLWSISGVSCIDYMEIYKTFSVGERESYSLNYICELELGEGKIAHNATSLASLAVDDWKTFVDYNIQDVHLLVKLEEKLKYLQIVRLLAYKGCTNLEAALGKVSIVTGAVSIQAYKQGYMIPTFGGNAEERESYEGGFVMDPARGLQKAVVSFDVNSLYPNTIITLNISPETKLGKIIEGDLEDTKEVTLRLINGKFHTLTTEKFKSFLQAEKISLSKAGVMYSQKSKGVIPSLIEQIYKERVDAKSKLQKLKRSKDSSAKCQAEMEYLDTLQYTLKIYLNSIYGTFANKHSSLMDIDNAMSITMTGQNVAKAGAEILRQYAKEHYGVEEQIAKYSDTDSLVGPTIIRTNIGSMPIEMLYDNFKDCARAFTFKGHELLDVENKHLKALTFFSDKKVVNWGGIKNLIRHKVSKKKYRIIAGGKEVIMTEDHGCMVLRGGELIRIAPADINTKTDKMVVIK